METNERTTHIPARTHAAPNQLPKDPAQHSTPV